MEKNTNKRITKAMQFGYIKAMLNGEVVTDANGKPYGVTEAAAFIDAELALLAKKNSGDTKKPTKAQEENNTLKVKIVEYLATQSEGVTASQTMAALGLTSNQKATALLNALVADGKVVKATVKGKSLFSLA